MTTPPAAPSAEALAPADGADTCAASRQETIDTLSEIAAYFRKDHAYEVENIGAGGSLIAAGRWKRYYRTIEYLADELLELPRILRERAAPDDSIRAAAKAGAEALQYVIDMAYSAEQANEARGHKALLERFAEGGK